MAARWPQREGKLLIHLAGANRTGWRGAATPDFLESMADACQAAQRLYKEWFVDLRFPVYEHVEIIDVLPANWSKASLTDCADVCMYWRIGKHLNGVREYGTNCIDSLSPDIRREYPEVKWANVRNLRYMAKFAREADEEIFVNNPRYAPRIVTTLEYNPQDCV